MISLSAAIQTAEVVVWPTGHVILIAVALIIGGLVILYLRGNAPGEVLKAVCLWAGAIILVLGLLVLLFPPLAWLYHQLTAMFGV